MTKRDFYNEIIELATDCERQDIIDFCNHELELLEKKSGSKGQTKTQKENETLKADLVKSQEESAKFKDSWYRAAADFENFKKRKYQYMAKDKEGRDVFLADSNYVLQMAQSDFKNIKFHFTYSIFNF